MVKRHRPPAGPCDGRSARGSAIAELAISLPLLGVLLIGAVDFGRVWYDALVIDSAAHAGAQYGARSTISATDMTGIQSAVIADLGSWGDQHTVDVVVVRRCNCLDGSAVDCDSGSCENAVAPRTYVNVTVASSFLPLIAYPGVPQVTTLSRTSEMRAR